MNDYQTKMSFFHGFCLVFVLFCFYQRPETFLGHLARWLWGHLEALGVLGGPCLPPVGLFDYNVCKLSFQFQFYERSTGGSCYHYSVIFFPLPLGSFTECEKCALTTRLQAWWQQRHTYSLQTHSWPGRTVFGLCDLRRPACTHFPGIRSLLYFFFFCIWLCPFQWPTMLLLLTSYDSVRESLQKRWGWTACDERQSEVSSPRRALLPLLWP